MSPFVIFAISLTIAYVIYYAVMITRDLYGKKEENKSNEEVFDVSSITEEEAAVAVNESDGGFCIANKLYDTSYQNGMGGDDGYGRGTFGSGSLENGIGGSGATGSGAGGSGSVGTGSVGYGTVGNEAGRNGIAGSGAGVSGVIGSGAGGNGYGSDGNEGDGSNHAGNNDSGVGAGGMTSDGDDANQQKKTAAESLQERVSDQMESISPIWINGLWQDEFTESLLRQGETKPGQPNIKTIPIKDEI